MPPEVRDEFVKLLAELRQELEQLGEVGADDEALRSILGFVDISAHEALRAEQDPELLDLALKGLRQAVDKFEQRHPRLIGLVNSVAQTLANLGI